jgi:hypothetical protein
MHLLLACLDFHARVTPLHTHAPLRPLPSLHAASLLEMSRSLCHSGGLLPLPTNDNTACFLYASRCIKLPPLEVCRLASIQAAEQLRDANRAVVGRPLQVSIGRGDSKRSPCRSAVPVR